MVEQMVKKQKRLAHLCNRAYSSFLARMERFNFRYLFRLR